MTQRYEDAKDEVGLELLGFGECLVSCIDIGTYLLGAVQIVVFVSCVVVADVRIVVDCAWIGLVGVAEILWLR